MPVRCVALTMETKGLNVSEGHLPVDNGLHVARETISDR